MKIIVRVILILIVAFFLRTLSSCCFPDARNAQYPGTHYSYDSVAVMNIDNRGATPEILSLSDTPNDTVPKKVSLLYILKLTAYQRDTGPSFFPGAYASNCCSCETISTTYPNDSLKSISVITNTPFNATHAAGAEITDYFKVADFGNYATISDFLYYNRYTTHNYDGRNEVDLYLLQPPDEEGIYSFTVTTILSDGRKLTSTTEPVYLF